MRYWWVNQNQTFKQEVEGGYLWCPKVKSNDTRNPFYDFIREVAPGDLIFSFAHTRIAAIGIAQSHAYEAAKPTEFGHAGEYWSVFGWRLEVQFTKLTSSIRPADFMDVLTPHLPERYSPLTAAGSGKQNLYITLLPDSFAAALLDLLGAPAQAVAASATAAPPKDESDTKLAQLELHLLQQVASDESIQSTEREAIVMARRGQGLFKRNVMKFESACRVTKVDRIDHLRASHCKPWRDSSNQERIDGENGLLLTPSIDHLFDRGFISFENNGRLLISPVAHVESLRRLGIPANAPINVGGFSPGQAKYLEYHRERVLLRSSFLNPK